MNEFSVKSNYEYFSKQMVKTARNQGVVGNSQERRTAPISWRKHGLRFIEFGEFHGMIFNARKITAHLSSFTVIRSMKQEFDTYVRKLYPHFVKVRGLV
jgi:hypothetical protein